MKIPKNVAQGMVIGGLAGMLGIAGTSLYNSLTNEITPKDGGILNGIAALGLISSSYLVWGGYGLYYKRKREESLANSHEKDIVGFLEKNIW